MILNDAKSGGWSTLRMLEANMLKAYKPKHKEMTPNMASTTETDGQKALNMVK